MSLLHEDQAFDFDWHNNVNPIEYLANQKDLDSDEDEVDEDMVAYAATIGELVALAFANAVELRVETSGTVIEVTFDEDDVGQ